MGEPALRFTDVRKSYAGAPALAGLSLEVRRGACFGLVGANGAGKTTLIKCLLDLCDVDAGDIEIFGVPHRNAGARARLAYLPERFTPPHYLTGADCLRYLLALHRVPWDVARAREVLAVLGFDPAALDKTARAYSRGMTQQLGLAACLLAGRDLCVLDEPAGGLDPRARVQLKRELGRLREAGGTVFLTSHALADVDETCDIMAVLDGGRLLFAGTPDALRERSGTRDLEQAYLACVETPFAAA